MKKVFKEVELRFIAFIQSKILLSMPIDNSSVDPEEENWTPFF